MISPSDRVFHDAFWKKNPQTAVFRHRAAVELFREGPIFDVGAGDGFFLSYFRERTGIVGGGADLSGHAAEEARRKGFEVIVSDVAFERPFPKDTFGSVFLLDVLEHMLEPNRLLNAAGDMSKRDVIISVPNFSSFPARLQVLFGRVPENNKPKKGHMYWFTWRELNRLISENGYVIDALRFNSVYSRAPVIGKMFQFLADRWPSLFALSFVVRAHKLQKP